MIDLRMSDMDIYLKLRDGVPSMWESVQDYGHGEATIICDFYGRKKKPLAYGTELDRRNGRHFLLPVEKGDCIIQATAFYKHIKGCHFNRIVDVVFYEERTRALAKTQSVVLFGTPAVTDDSMILQALDKNPVLTPYFNAIKIAFYNVTVSEAPLQTYADLS